MTCSLFDERPEIKETKLMNIFPISSESEYRSIKNREQAHSNRFNRKNMSAVQSDMNQPVAAVAAVLASDVFSVKPVISREAVNPESMKQKVLRRQHCKRVSVSSEPIKKINRSPVSTRMSKNMLNNLCTVITASTIDHGPSSSGS
jgi:hypothetical protein